MVKTKHIIFFIVSILINKMSVCDSIHRLNVSLGPSPENTNTIDLATLDVETKELIATCDEKILEAVKNCDLILFIKIIRLFKLGLISKEIFKKQDLLDLVEETFIKFDDSKDWPWTFKEYGLMSFNVCVQITCSILGYFIANIITQQFRQTLPFSRFNAIEIIPNLCSGAFIGFIVSLNTIFNSECAQKAVNIKYIRKLIKKFSSLNELKKNEKNN